MSKILFISTDLPDVIGGITKYSVSLLKIFRKKNYNVDIIGIPALPYNVNPIVENYHVDIFDPFKYGKIESLNLFRKFLKKYNFKSYDVIIMANVTPLFFIWVKVLKKYRKKVYLIHHDSKNLERKNIFKKYFYLKGVKFFNNIVNSDWLKERFIAHGINNVSVLYPLFDTEEFLKIPKTPIPNVPDKQIFKILTVSRLVEHKGHLDVLKALKKLENKIDFFYVVAGDGPFKERIAHSIKNLNLDKKVLLTGKVTDKELAFLYSWCDIFIMVSKNLKDDMEGFGYTFIEANLYGKPVIGTSIGGIPSAIENNKTGLLIEQGNIAMLEEAILTLYKDESLRNMLGSNGEKIGYKKCDLNYNSSLVLELFKLK